MFFQICYICVKTTSYEELLDSATTEKPQLLFELS